MKFSPIDPVFSNRVRFNKKVLTIICSTNSKSLLLSIFFEEIQKLSVLKKAWTLNALAKQGLTSTE